MALADGLEIIFSVVSAILDVFMQINLFGIPIGIFIIVAFVIGCIMKFIFNVDSDSKGGE